MRTQRIFVAQATGIELETRTACPAIDIPGSVGGGACQVPRAGARLACQRRCVDRRAALAAARRAAAAFGEVASRSLLLEHRPGAAPAVRLSDAGEPRYTLAIAHSRGRAVAAAAPRGARIGVDLERDGGVSTAEVRYFAGPDEIRDGVPPTTLWALKEAAWKAIGPGEATPFRALRLELRGGRVVAVRLDGARLRASARVWAPWRGWTAALVELHDVAPAVVEVVA